MKNNKGFSFIEVIVVIAIMAIVTGLSVNMLGNARRSKMRNFANNVKNSIDEVKSDGLSKKGYYRIIIKRDGDDIVAKEMYSDSKSSTYTVKDTNKLVSNDTNSDYNITETKSGITYDLSSYMIVIEFDKSDGTMSMVHWCNGTEASPTTVSEISDLRMKFGDDGKSLTFSKITGKYYFD